MAPTLNGPFREVVSLGSLNIAPVVGVMKMGNIVPRAGIEPTSLAFQVSVLIIIPRRLPCCNHYTHAYLSMWCVASEVNAVYYTHPSGIISLYLVIAYNYIHTGNGIHSIGSTTIQCIACTRSWSRQPVSWM